MEGGSLHLDEDEREVVAQEAAAASRALEGGLALDAQRLAEAARLGSVPAGLVGLLEQVVMASLQGGRARHKYTAEGERTLVRLLLRTPLGQQVESQLALVNKALGSLRGRQVEEARVVMRSPGHFVFELKAGAVGLTLSFRPNGVYVDALSA